MANKLKELQDEVTKLTGQRGKLQDDLSTLDKTIVTLKEKLEDELLSGTPDNSSHLLREAQSKREVLAGAFEKVGEQLRQATFDLEDLKKAMAAQVWLDLAISVRARMVALEDSLAKVKAEGDALLQTIRDGHTASHDDMVFFTRAHGVVAETVTHLDSSWRMLDGLNYPTKY